MANGWDEAYSVRIDSMDQQHRELFRLVAEMESADDEPLAHAAHSTRLKLFIRHMREHFRAEEKLFTDYAYPEGPLHRLHHETFIHNLTDFKERIDEGTLTLSREIRQFLQDWLVNHIVKIDARYSQYLVEAGAARAV